MNETIKNLLERRSIRSYKPEPISDAELAVVLEAGTYAPSGGGRQSAVLIAVQNKEVIEKLDKLNARFTDDPNNHPFYGAPTLVLALTDRNSGVGVQDASLCMGNMMNAAHAIGLGSVWINRVREMFDSEDGKALLKEWGVEGDLLGVGACLLGYPVGEYPTPKPRKENYVYYVK